MGPELAEIPGLSQSKTIASGHVVCPATCVRSNATPVLLGGHSKCLVRSLLSGGTVGHTPRPGRLWRHEAGGRGAGSSHPPSSPFKAPDQKGTVGTVIQFLPSLLGPELQAGSRLAGSCRMCEQAAEYSRQGLPHAITDAHQPVGGSIWL